MSNVREKQPHEIESKVDITRQELYFLYKYHQNYKKEKPEKQRQIRYYYENNLRYKGSFYKDKKRFKKDGNPKKWSDKKVLRFKTLGSYKDKKYYYGSRQYYKSFTYKSNKVIDVSLIKKCRILLAYRENNVLVINDNALDDVKEIVREMSRKITEFDKVKRTVKVKKTDHFRNFNLEEVQVIYKINVGSYKRWISTKFFSIDEIVKEANRKLENYVRAVVFTDNVKDEGLEAMQLNKYEEFEGEIDIRDLYLIEIVLRKRTDNYLSLGEKEITGYDLETRKLRGYEVVKSG